MKILLICDHPEEIGGVSNYTRPLIQEFLRQGVDITVLCTSVMLHHYHFFRKSGIRKVSEHVFESFISIVWWECLSPYMDFSKKQAPES